MRILVMILALLAHPGLAHEYKAGGIEVDHPYAFPSRGPTAAGYMSITNKGPDDQLLEIRADVPRVTVHKSVVVDDVARMRAADDIMIPQGETLTFEPGGLHIMFMGLANNFAEGDKFQATLVFERAGEVDVLFHVEPRPDGQAEIDHSNH